MKKHHFFVIFSVLIVLCTQSFARDYYWEDPLELAPIDSRFPSSASNGKVSMLLWQEIVPSVNSTGNIYLSTTIYNGSRWNTYTQFAGPFSYAGEIPSVTSCAINKANRIVVSAVNSKGEVSVLYSDTLGASWTQKNIYSNGENLLSPQIFSAANGGFLLFATKGGESSFSLQYSYSSDGLNWQPFKNFQSSENLKNAFLPTHASIGSTDYLVFQAWYENQGRYSYQLYASTSNDGGVSWSTAKLISNNEGNTANQTGRTFYSWHNQRPKLQAFDNNLALVWERALTSSQKYAIFYAPLKNDASFAENPQQVSLGSGECYAPDLVFIDKTPMVVWFDNRKGVNRIYLAQKEGFLWEESEISRTTSDAVFGKPLVAGNALEIFWQQTKTKTSQRIVRLAPDQTVRKPIISASNFQVGKKSRNTSLRFAIQLPEDSSGIAGYSWIWSKETNPFVPFEVQQLPTNTILNLQADTDGSWFLGVRAADYAGNWSEPTYLEFVRDTTPPSPPLIADAQYDINGFLSSNTASLYWKPENIYSYDESNLVPDDDIAGYSWRFEYLASLDYLPVLKRTAENLNLDAPSQEFAQIVPASFNFQVSALNRLSYKAPQPVNQGKQTSISFTNYDNGIYALTVSAIDSAGNISAPAVKYFALNKYIAYTYITWIDSKVDESGLVNLSIIGRGFSDSGKVSQIIFDRDGQEPWDLVLSEQSGLYKVVNDRLISNISLTDLEEGQYRIILQHPVRGRYISKPLLSISEFGTVKFGDYRYEFVPPWAISPSEKGFKIHSGTLLLSSALFFIALVFIFSLKGVSSTAREIFYVKEEIKAILQGDVMPSEKKKKARSLRRKGVGLKFKLAFFTGTLVISVVFIVSIPLGLQFSANQEQTLAKGLEDRVKVLLDSLSSGARAYLPSQNILELGFLPDQISALSEAKSATITGFSSNAQATGVDFVWATNDPAVITNIDTPSLVIGQSKLIKPENEDIQTRLTFLDTQAQTNVSEMSQSISALTQEGIKLALLTDTASVQRRDEIQTITRQLEEKMNIELNRLSSSGTGSWPTYDTSKLSRDNTNYIFYKPVLFRQGTDTHFVRGIVRVDISTESLLEAIDKDRQMLIQTTSYVALVAVLIGILGALALASIIISPVRKLALHVAMIRDTEDKESLEGKEIQLKSKDEIGVLGDTINDMTRGLVKAAAASKDLTVGKEVQKMFIPLETDSNGRKLTCGSTKEEKASFFGYYEGAKGVSGDYFDYIKLDDRHFAIIKCDVAGKGVPAALIMVEVATLFLDYFKDWTYKKNGYQLGYIVSRINDLIESRGFKGRFAAFTLCIFDSFSGDLHFCNAGDNIVHIYESDAKKMKVISLPETSAAGVFPSFMIDMKGGFSVSKVHLNKGDVLFLYTDGIEEAKRLFRSPDLQIYICAEPGLEKDAPHGTHSVGQDNEELGPERVNAIIEAVFSRSKYTLQKWHNPIPNEMFEFDFTTCTGSIEEAILALVSVEKIFRMYQDTKATEFNRVQVDRKVDSFLNKHFAQYAHYCAKRKDHPEYGEYLYYTHVKEDDQYDDLTLLAIKRD